MSNGVNKVFLLGHLGATPELRQSPGGMSVLRLNVATNEHWERDGEKRDHTEWHRVVIFGNRAEALAKFLDKGMCVMIEGRIRTSSYEKEGQKRTSTEIHATELCLTSARRASDGGGLVRAPRPPQPAHGEELALAM
ncbi:MAG: single-stranded DNA-binding protein [Polyangiaceae bacterium]|nr:single-stranded DNA-binding protein [Polyangiaceae bacterium]